MTLLVAMSTVILVITFGLGVGLYLTGDKNELKSTVTQTTVEEAKFFLTEYDSPTNPDNLTGEDLRLHTIAEQRKTILKYKVQCVLYQLSSQSEKRDVAYMNDYFSTGDGTYLNLQGYTAVGTGVLTEDPPLVAHTKICFRIAPPKT